MLAVTGRERGDTLIEVIFATAVLALIIVLSIGIMTSGTAQAERSVEGTFVRQSIDSQTELLRFARDSYVNGNAGASAVWKSITDQRVATSGVTPFSDLAGLTQCKPPIDQAFWLQTSGNAVSVQRNFTVPDTFAAPGNGIWIEAASTDATANYVDFYVYACWGAPNSGAKNSTSGTVVRLYAPAQ